MTALRGSILTGLAALVAIGCSGGTPSTLTPPSPPPVTGPPQGPPSTATIVIGSNNTFIPLEVTVAAGGRVSIENRNSRAFDIMSDPPLIHTDCPPVQEVGFIQPGQTKQTERFKWISRSLQRAQPGFTGSHHRPADSRPS